MQVTFTKAGERRYRVSVEGPGVVNSFMDPAPGYDELLPHDMAHFVVENALNLQGGVFGQLANGGHANTFRPVDVQKNNRAKRRGNKISAASKRDATLAERVIFVAQRTWMKGDMTDVPRVREISDRELDQICAEFEKVSAVWSRLAVGESMTLEWTAGKKPHRNSR